MTTIWVDDVRIPPEGFLWVKSVNQAIDLIKRFEEEHLERTGKMPTYEDLLIDLDYDAGDYYHDGGVYIKILDWLAENGRDYSLRLHTRNSVGMQYMKTMIERRNWRLLY